MVSHPPLASVSEPPRRRSLGSIRKEWLRSATVTLESGLMITDQIRLEHLLDEGGMGSIWVAKYLATGTHVAVKFVLPDPMYGRAEMHHRFLREAEAVAKITSPNVVRTYEFGAMSDGTPFLVMELLRGESLDDRLDRDGPMPASDLAGVVTQIARGLDEAHRAGIIHRDIKPANIFLSRARGGEVAKLIDFGIAKDMAATDGSTKTGSLLGTPQYMSPEQLLHSKGVDAGADVWALAVTAYEALTGKSPFGASSVPLVIIAINARQFTKPSALPAPPLVADLDALDAFFERAFAEKQEDRFASAVELAEAFAEACRDSIPVTDTIVSAPCPVDAFDWDDEWTVVDPPASFDEGGETSDDLPTEVVNARKAATATPVSSRRLEATPFEEAPTCDAYTRSPLPLPLPRRREPRAAGLGWFIGLGAIGIAVIALAATLLAVRLVHQAAAAGPSAFIRAHAVAPEKVAPEKLAPEKVERVAPSLARSAARSTAASSKGERARKGR